MNTIPLIGIIIDFKRRRATAYLDDPKLYSSQYHFPSNLTMRQIGSRVRASIRLLTGREPVPAERVIVQVHERNGSVRSWRYYPAEGKIEEEQDGKCSS